MSALLAFACYGLTWAGQIRNLGQRKQNPAWLFYLLIPALIFHSYSVYSSIFSDSGFHLGLFQMASALFLAMNVIVGISSLRLPLKSVFTLLLPLSMASLLCSLYFAADHTLVLSLSLSLVMHILLSVLAYSILTIATLQAILLNYQASQLKQHHVKSILGVFPPLQTMESLLFDLLWAGFIVLSLSIVTGFVFIDNLYEQHLLHKTAFSILSWFFYAVLLAGRHALGWRGKAALRWVMAAFVMLVLAYFGTKFVLEFIVQRS